MASKARGLGVELAARLIVVIDVEALNQDFLILGKVWSRVLVNQLRYHDKRGEDFIHIVAHIFPAIIWNVVKDEYFIYPFLTTNLSQRTVQRRGAQWDGGRVER